MKDNKLEEIKNKQLLVARRVLIITELTFYIGIILLAAYAVEEQFLLGIIVFLATAFLVADAFYALKLELQAGYYECKHCHHRFIPGYFEAVMTAHINTTRYLKCPKCNKRAWAKKVLTK